MFCYHILGMVYGKSYFDARPILCDAIATVCLTVCVSALFSIGGVSYTRYFYICHHGIYGRIFGLKTNLVVCCCCWILGMCSALPTLVGWTDNVYDTKSLECIWDRLHSMTFTIFFACLIFVPVAVILYSYVRIFLFFIASKKRLAAAQAAPKQKTDPSLKLARSLFVIFAIFVACWSPYATLVVIDFEDNYSHQVHLYVVMVAHLHATLNPVVHGLTNEQFRRAYLILVQHIFRLNNKINPGQVTTDGIRTDGTSHQHQRSIG